MEGRVIIGNKSKVGKGRVTIQEKGRVTIVVKVG